jgi:RNA recognition motif-containing protein
MKLYVGNLPYTATDSEVREMFEAYGTVTDVHLPVDRETGRPRGFAFVSFADREAATAAMEGLNGNDIGGRAMRISEALERTAPGGGGGNYGAPRRSYGGGGGGGGGGYGGGGGRGGKDRNRDRRSFR